MRRWLFAKQNRLLVISSFIGFAIMIALSIGVGMSLHTGFAANLDRAPASID